MWPERFLPTPVGSFVESVVPPTTDPSDEPLVCVSFNASWLPYVLGALSQLMNPASWETPDDNALQTTLSAATELLFMVGQGGNCVTYELRFTAACGLEFSTDGGTTWTGVTDWTTYFDECVAPHLRQTSGGILQYSIDGGATWINVPGSTPPQFQLTSGCGLQYSIDGGTTWIDIPGWIANFAQCVQTNAPPTGAPPNPQGYTTDALSCAVAAYAVEEIIQGAIQKAIDSVNNNSTLLQFGVDVALLLPGFDMVAAFMEAVYLLYPLVNAGNVAAFQSAMTDATLWQEVTCAIYNAIKADGKLTAANFSVMLANIAAISYTTPAVISAIHDYIQALGLAGMQQLIQPAGLAASGGCSGCPGATWCVEWDFSTGSHTWTATGGSSGNGSWVNTGAPASTGWYGNNNGTNCVLDIQVTASGTSSVTSVELIGNCGSPASAGSWERQVIDTVTGTPYDFSQAAFPSGFDIVVPVNATVGGLRLVFYSDAPGGTFVGKIVVRGTGAGPSYNGQVAC